MNDINVKAVIQFILYLSIINAVTGFVVDDGGLTFLRHQSTLLPLWTRPWIHTAAHQHSFVRRRASLVDNVDTGSDNGTAESFLEQGYVDRFGGIGRLYDGQALSSGEVLRRMRQSTVVVAGVGGVGSWAAEALCRSGIGNLVLIDLDDICISNSNRQLHATTSGVGQMKTEVMKQRLLDINPECNVTVIHDFVSEENAKGMLEGVGPITALIDAIDGATEKSALIGACADLAIPVVTCGGAAGRRDPFQIICGDLVSVEDDRLLASCRRILRKKHGFPPGLSFSQQRVQKKKLKKWRISCVYTREAPPVKSEAPPGEATSTFRLCDGSLGTACFVTGSYGFAAASLCVDMIAQDKLRPPRRG